MKLRRRCMQTLGVSVKRLRRKLLELGARILHVQGSKPPDMALVVRLFLPFTGCPLDPDNCPFSVTLKNREVRGNF